jgi:predicted TIM-barrel fold metal-dependent hydrolase
MWPRGMAASADYANLHVKISFLYLPDGPWTIELNLPIALDNIETFGVERYMCASKFPVDELRASFDMIYCAVKTIAADMLTRTAKNCSQATP